DPRVPGAGIPGHRAGQLTMPHASVTGEVEQASPALQRIEALLAAYPGVTHDELEHLRRGFAREATALDVGLIAGNGAVAEGYRRFRAEHIDPLTLADLARAGGVPAAGAAIALAPAMWEAELGDPHVEQRRPRLREAPGKRLVERLNRVDEPRGEALRLGQLDEIDPREIAPGHVVHPELGRETRQRGVGGVVEDHEADVRLLLTRREQALDRVHRRAVAENRDDFVGLGAGDADRGRQRIAEPAAGAGVEPALAHDRQRVVLGAARGRRFLDDH